MSRFDSINFYQNGPKIKLFLPKNTKISSAGGGAPGPSCLRLVAYSGIFGKLHIR